MIFSFQSQTKKYAHQRARLLELARESEGDVMLKEAVDLLDISEIVDIWGANLSQKQIYFQCKRALNQTYRLGIVDSVHLTGIFQCADETPKALKLAV